MRPATSFSPADLFNCCTALKEPGWSKFTNLELGGCVDVADERIRANALSS